MDLLCHVIFQEFRLARKSGSDFFSVIAFFLVVVSVSSFLLKSVLWIGSSLALCMCWIICMTSYILSIEKFFSRDLEDGSLEFYISLQQGSFIIFLGKIISHWILHGLPLSVCSFSLYIFYSVPFAMLLILPMTICFGTLLLSMLAFLSYALTFRLKYRSSILSILLLPLYFPILLLNINFVDAYVDNQEVFTSLQVYLGISILMLIITSLLSHYALRYSIE